MFPRFSFILGLCLTATSAMVGQDIPASRPVRIYFIDSAKACAVPLGGSLRVEKGHAVLETVPSFAEVLNKHEGLTTVNRPNRIVSAKGFTGFLIYTGLPTGSWPAIEGYARQDGFAFLTFEEASARLERSPHDQYGGFAPGVWVPLKGHRFSECGQPEFDKWQEELWARNVHPQTTVPISPSPISPKSTSSTSSSNTPSLTSSTTVNREEHLYPASRGDRWGFINARGEFAIAASYDQVLDFAEGRAAVRVGRQWGFIDTHGKAVCAPQFDGVRSYSDGMANVRVNGSLAYVDLACQMAISPHRSWEFSDFSDGLALIVPSGGPGFLGYIDHHGAAVITPASLARMVGPRLSVTGTFDFSEDVAVINVLDIGVRPPTSYARLIDKSGRLYGTFQAFFAGAMGFKDGLIVVCPTAELKYGYMNKDGTLLIPAIYEDAHEFSEGLASVKLGGKWGFIDRTGKVVVPMQFEDAGVFKNGLASVRVKNQGMGFIDKVGNMRIPPRYKQVSNFSDKLAGVIVDSHPPVMGYINSSGDWVWRSQLPDNLSSR